MGNSGRCTPEYRELISGYLDGDLSDAERQQLLAHLGTCEDCRLTLESYRRIGGQLRSLPRAVPPPELREAIYAETIDSSSRRIYLLSSRVGYSVAALAAVVLIFIVAVYLLVNGYQRSIDPEVIASQPGNGVLWPLSRPVEITFNKEMDQESVESALSILPASEKDRLTITWDGNTLVLGENQTLHSASSYSILITTTAQDKWGKNLGSEFRLQFETSESFALQTPEPIPTATATVTSTATQPPAPTAAAVVTPTLPQQAPGPPQSTVEETEPAEPLDPTATQESVAPPPPPTNVAPPAPTASQPPTDLPVPTPTSEPTIEPTATPTVDPTATPEPTRTPRPVPSATPTKVPPTPTTPPTATPDTIAVVGAFGNVYWTNDVVQNRLGAPLAAAHTTTGVELDFQHGAMISRSDTSQTYVLESAVGVWSVVPSSAESTNSEPGPLPDTWVPGGSLGALWSAEAWIQSSLGFALAPSGAVFDSRVQSFEAGTMLMSSSGQIYVIYGDGAWELYPDPGS